MPEEVSSASGVATVVRQEGDTVVVSLPVSGFPEGFELLAGDEVALAHTEDGMVAMPLVDVEEIEVAASGDEAGMQSDAGQYEFAQATARDDDFAGPSAGKTIHAKVWTIRSSKPGAPKRVVGVRRV